MCCLQVCAGAFFSLEISQAGEVKEFKQRPKETKQPSIVHHLFLVEYGSFGVSRNLWLV